MTSVRSRNHRRRGSALIPVLILMAGLVALTTAFLNQSSAVKGEVASYVDDQRADLMAEAGLSEALMALRAGASGAVGTADQPAQLGEGILWVECEDLGDDRLRLVAHAAAGSGRHSKALVVHREGGGLGQLFRATLNSKDTLTMNEGVMVDSYDSRLGDYASQATNTTNGHTHAGTNGDVLSNVGITMNTDATVLGDATPGPGQSVIMAPTSYVDGSTAPAPTPFEFPPLEVPSYGSSGALSVTTTYDLPAGDWEFDDLAIAKDAVLTIHGPANVVVPSFTGGKNAKLLIDAVQGPVTIYCESYVHTSGFATSAVEGSAAAVAFLITGPNDIVFPAGALVQGAYYAEQSNIVFANQCEAFGSFVANRVEMSSSMKFHYDEALAEHWQGGDGEDQAPFTRIGRYPVAVAGRYAADRRDPFAILGVRPEQLPSPSQAWIW